MFSQCSSNNPASSVRSHCLQKYPNILSLTGSTSTWLLCHIICHHPLEAIPSPTGRGGHRPTKRQGTLHSTCWFQPFKDLEFVEYYLNIMLLNLEKSLHQNAKTILIKHQTNTSRKQLMIGLIRFNLHAKKRICPLFTTTNQLIPITWAPSEDHSRLGGRSNIFRSSVGSVVKLVVSTLSWFTYGSVMVVVFVTQLEQTVVSFEMGSWFHVFIVFFSEREVCMRRRKCWNQHLARSLFNAKNLINLITKHVHN